MGTGDEGRLRAVITEVVIAAGYDVEDIAVRSAGRRRVVKVIIDADNGVTLDAAADVSRAISAELDDAGESDPTGVAPYTLEVTSPGVGRPLTAPRHFRRARTRLVALTTSDGQQLVGHVLASDDTTVTLVLSGRRGISQQRVPLADIATARVDVEFSPPSTAVLDLLGVGSPAEPDADPDDDAGEDADPAEFDAHQVEEYAAEPGDRNEQDDTGFPDANSAGSVSTKRANR